jgi:hypothetical protein
VISHEWRQDHTLSRTSLRWLEEHADPGDAHPIATALAALRALELSHE